MLNSSKANAPSLDNAVRLMPKAVAVLDQAGANVAACKLQHAIDIVRAKPQV